MEINTNGHTSDIFLRFGGDPTSKWTLSLTQVIIDPVVLKIFLKTILLHSLKYEIKISIENNRNPLHFNLFLDSIK